MPIIFSLIADSSLFEKKYLSRKVLVFNKLTKYLLFCVNFFA